MQLILFCAIGAILALGAYTLLVWLTVSRSINASKPLIARAIKYERHASASAMRILVAGDSRAVGVVAGDNTYSLAGRIGNNFPQAGITNIAVSGSKLADLEAQLISQKGSRYDLIFITIGANDITGRTQYADANASLGRVLSATDALGSKTIVLTAGDVGLSPAFLWPLSRYFDARSRGVRTLFMNEIAKHAQAQYVDLFREKKDEVFNTDIPRYYAADHFHPSAEGYAVWYTQFKPLL